MIYPQAILSMIEIDKDVDKFVYTTGQGVKTVTLTRNTYANVLDLMWEINDNMTTGSSMYMLGDVTDFFPVVEFSDEESPGVSSIAAGTIKDILFETYTILETSVTAATATIRPLKTWIPKYRSNDGAWFRTESASAVKGSIGVAGNLSAIVYTPRKKRSFEFPFVLRENTFTEYSATLEDYTPASNRSFETVINGARENYLNYADSGNIYCLGVYYLHSIEPYLGAGNLTTDWGNGYVNNQNYLFCTADAPAPGGQSDSTRNTHFDVTLSLTTGTAPSWDN